MQRARGSWWAALLLLVPSAIAACDRDAGDPATSSDGEAEEASAGSDDSNATDDADASEPASTCDDVVCPAGHVCVQPRPYCDASVDPPALRIDPPYCQPVVAPPEQSRGDGARELTAEGEPLGMPVCEGGRLSEDERGGLVVTCPDGGLPCA